jgi:hypothetical protein
MLSVHVGYYRIKTLINLLFINYFKISLQIHESLTFTLKSIVIASILLIQHNTHIS